MLYIFWWKVNLGLSEEWSLRLETFDSDKNLYNWLSLDWSQNTKLTNYHWDWKRWDTAWDFGQTLMKDFTMKIFSNIKQDQSNDQ